MSHPISLMWLEEMLLLSVQVDLDTLATREKVEYDDGIKGALTTAHPAIYPDGSIYNLFQEVGALSSPCALTFRRLGSL